MSSPQITEPADSETPQGRSAFPDTRWSLILSAGSTDAHAANRALNEVCKLYWYPVYAYIRAWGRPPADAEDLAQGFFFQMLCHEGLLRPDSSMGRFRTYLLKAVQNYLHSEKKRESALKRGGGEAVVIPLQIDEAEARYQSEPVDETTPELLFERKWALELIRTALTQLESEYRQDGNGAIYESLSRFLSRPPSASDYRDACKELDVPAGTARSHVHRMRKRYYTLVSDEVAQTLENREDVDAELQHLISVLGRGGVMSLNT